MSHSPPCRAVFSTLHTNDAIGAIPRLIDLGVQPYLLAPTLAGVLAQRLVRRLCSKCRLPVADPAAKLAGLKIIVPTDLPPSLWEAGSCAECHHTGYRGRVGIHEFLAMDPSFHPAIVNGLDVPRLQQLAKDRGFRPMFQDGINKALRGQTTVEEILRVTQQ